MFGPPREDLAPGHGRDVTVWASFVKLWMRELSGPLIPSDGHYDRAIKLAGDNLARARASGTAAGTPVRRTASSGDQLEPEPQPAPGDLEPWVAEARCDARPTCIQEPIASVSSAVACCVQGAAAEARCEPATAEPASAAARVRVPAGDRPGRHADDGRQPCHLLRAVPLPLRGHDDGPPRKPCLVNSPHGV